VAAGVGSCSCRAPQGSIWLGMLPNRQIQEPLCGGARQGTSDSTLHAHKLPGTLAAPICMYVWPAKGGCGYAAQQKDRLTRQMRRTPVARVWVQQSLHSPLWGVLSVSWLQERPLAVPPKQVYVQSCPAGYYCSPSASCTAVHCINPHTRFLF
jgi:hypothetical protein